MAGLRQLHPARGLRGGRLGPSEVPLFSRNAVRSLPNAEGIRERKSLSMALRGQQRRDLTPEIDKHH